MLRIICAATVVWFAGVLLTGSAVNALALPRDTARAFPLVTSSPCQRSTP